MFAVFATEDRRPARLPSPTVPALVASALAISFGWTVAVGLWVDQPPRALVFGPILSLMVILPAWTAAAAGFELSGEGSPRRVAALASLAAVPWLGLSLVFSPAQIVAVPLLLAAICYGAQRMPTRDLPVVKAWSEAQRRFALAAWMGRPYRWRVALLAAPGMAAVGSVAASGGLASWLGTIEGSELEALLVPLVVLFLLPFALGWCAAAGLPVARGPMVRYLRGLYAKDGPTRGLARGPTLGLLAADMVLLVTVVCWGATTFLGAYSPVGSISLLVTVLGLTPAVIGRLLVADVAVLRGGDLFDTVASAFHALVHRPLELVRLLAVQLAVAGAATVLVLTGPAGLVVLAVLVDHPTATKWTAGVAVGVALFLAWIVGPPIWVLLALHRLGTLSRCLEPPVGPDTPTIRFTSLPPVSPLPRSFP